MYQGQFVYWYAYFDTLFCKKQPIAYQSLVYMIKAKTTSWPTDKCRLPQLCQSFSQLQSYILDEKNWNTSICTIDQLNKVEADVNNLLLLLQIQKLYIINFWDDSKRRVEASLTHLYSFLQIFVGSIIPYNNMTLFQCKAANKLCMKIINLQNLFKSIMKKINSICAFFADQYFDEEGLILKNFFQNFVAFMQLIPKIKKFKMFHVSELLRYIMIVNSLQIVTIGHQKHTKLTAKLKKDIIQPEQKRKTVSLHKPTYQIQKQAKRKKYNSTLKIKLTENEYNERLQNNANSLRFIFPNWIRRHSIRHKKQSLPRLKIESFANIAKGKSNSEFKISYSPKQKKFRNKSATKSQALLKSMTLNQRSSPVKQNRSKKSTTLERHLTIYEPDVYDHEDDESQLIQPLSSTLIREAKYTKNYIEQLKNDEFQNKFKIKTISLKQKQKQNSHVSILAKDYIVIKQIQEILNS